MQITRHLLRLLHRMDRDEVARLRYVTPAHKKLQTLVLNRRELQDSGLAGGPSSR